ncbi:hypothetical protein GCM10027614_05930 [Micromonospora vulcania]
MTTVDFEHVFGGARVMAILRGLPVAETVRLANRAWDLGIDVVEVPVATADAVAALRATVEAGSERGRIVGAGTVLDVEQVAAAPMPVPRSPSHPVWTSRSPTPPRRGACRTCPVWPPRPRLSRPCGTVSPGSRRSRRSRSVRPGSGPSRVRCRSCVSSPPAASTRATPVRSSPRAYGWWRSARH